MGDAVELDGAELDRLLDSVSPSVRRAVLHALDTDAPTVESRRPASVVNRSKSTWLLSLALYIVLVIRFVAKLVYSISDKIVAGLRRRLTV